MKRGNMPKVEIQYLIDIGIDVDLANSSLNNLIGRLDEITKDTYTKDEIEHTKFGKKGFFLSGGSVDTTTGEVSGCLLNGSYEMFEEDEKYHGAIGTILSDDNYEFSTPQTIKVEVLNENTFIKYLAIYFDNIAKEYATEIVFDNKPSKINRNTKYTYIKNFAEDGDEGLNLTTVKMTFQKWSKKNSLAKVLKIRTGIRGVYDYKTIKSFKVSNEKISNIEEISFGISSQYANLKVFDKNGEIMALYNANLLLENVIAEFYIVNEETINGGEEGLQNLEVKEKIGEFVLDTKNIKNNSNLWSLDFIDKLEGLKNNNAPPLEIIEWGSLYTVLTYVLQFSGFEVDWEENTKNYVQGIYIWRAYIEPNQTIYEVVCKCCEIGLLKVFINVDGKLRIERGI